MSQIYFASGCYTEKLPHAPFASGEGIGILRLDDETGELFTLSTLGGMRNPSYLDWDGSCRRLYAVTESLQGDGEIRSYTLGSDFSLVPGSVLTGPGRAGCHLEVVPALKRIYATSYLDGCLKSYALEDDDAARVLHTHEYTGTGPDLLRQESPHAHQVQSGPDRRHLYVCDLGSDRVWVHDALGEGLPLLSSLSVPPGYGPRHLAFDPRGEYAYILCELVPRLLVARINQSDGRLTIEQDLSSVGVIPPGGAAPAAVKIHPSGMSIAVSNRFDDTITLFEIRRDGMGGPVTLEVFDTFDSRGKTPRDICFSPSGQWLLMAHQDSDDVQVRAFDRKTGLPGSRWARPLKLRTPVCLIPLG